ncbi:hypothetical protein PCANB_001506 [Pneumocystis canis]|nr:hypothetical protein PCK1_001528 [Pneumocystis canis]KAG5439207.1 hypothetical protein PCANB_001506 [Pneumocystis canis]
MKTPKKQLPPKIPIKKENDKNISFKDSVLEFYNNYQNHTIQSLKIIDYFIIFLIISGFFQLLYCILSGSYPFNAFLSGFFSTIGQIVLTASLRYQFDPKNTDFGKDISLEKAFKDFIFSSIILHFFVINFLG